MKRKLIDTVDGWEIKLNKNIHMYSHSLTVKKKSHIITIPCEDLPRKENTIGIWLYDISATDNIIKELQHVLLKWVSDFEETFLIYIARSEFITNKIAPNKSI